MDTISSLISLQLKLTNHEDKFPHGLRYRVRYKLIGGKENTCYDFLNALLNISEFLNYSDDAIDTFS